MAKENYMINRKKRILFYLLMVIILCWFVALQFFGTNEREIQVIEGNILYQGTFIWKNQMEAVRRLRFRAGMNCRRRKPWFW